MNNFQWHLLKSPHEHIYINDDDICIYAREYKAQQSWQGGITNQLIFNFKKSPFKKDTPQWQYRNQTIKKFKDEINMLLNQIDFKETVIAVSSSKTKNHPEYDNRFEDLFEELFKSNSNLNIEWPIEVKQTTLLTPYIVWTKIVQLYRH